MAKTIDPAFQAAPYLGDSSHDPIQFARRQNLQKFQAQKQKYEETQRNTARGLENLMVDIKGWEDQQGFKEIMAEQDKIMNGFLDLSRKGLNLVSPKTTQEIMAYKAITDAHEQLKQKVDTWNTQKGVYDLVKKAIEVDSAKPESDQRIDRDATMGNMSKVLQSKSIYERGAGLQNLIVTKPEIGDVHKYVADNLEFITKPDIITEPYTDPVTGQAQSRTREVMSSANEKAREKDLRNLYATAPDPVKNAVKQQREKERDPNLNVMKDEDYFVAMYDPQFKQKFIDKTVGTGGGFALNFLGQKTSMGPGIERDPLPYGERTYSSPYEFQNTKPIKVNYGDSGSSIFMGNQWIPLKGGGDVEAELRFYDSNRDEFIFRTTQPGIAPFVQNNMTFAVPRSIIGDQADNLPIKVGGQIKKLKDVYGTMQKTKKELPGLGTNFWNKPSSKPYIPKSK